MKAFQLRSRAVRAASQDLMRRLRDERAAASRHSPRPKAVTKGAAAVAPAPVAPTVDIKPSRLILASAPADAALPVAMAKPRARPRKPKIKPVETTEPSKAHAAAVEAKIAVKIVRPKKAAAGPVQALQQALAETLAPAEIVVKTAAGHAEKSVSAVPTLGPGMVWRLNQLGVTTLGDLAAQDAEGLKRQLGRLGRMVNVEQWITYAKGG
jgi:predicted flap endonuclease-1-like 5' DNA nuclease